MTPRPQPKNPADPREIDDVLYALFKANLNGKSWVLFIDVEDGPQTWARVYGDAAAEEEFRDGCVQLLTEGAGA